MDDENDTYSYRCLCVYYEYIVSDDDTSMRKHLNDHMKRPTCKKNIGGYLFEEIPVPTWFSDPAHRTKCVVGAFFELVKSIKSMKRLDEMILKKYYSYYIKMNRKRIVEDIMKNIMVTLDHIL